VRWQGPPGGVCIVTGFPISGGRALRFTSCMRPASMPSSVMPGPVLTRTHMASDATAQTFLVAWRRAEFFGARYPLAGLLGVTRRTLAGERRAASRQAGLCDRAGATVAPLPRDPATAVTKRDVIAAAVSRLSDTDREVLALIAWHDLSPGEAAEVLGCSRAAFPVKLHRARSRFSHAPARHRAPPGPCANRVLARCGSAAPFAGKRSPGADSQRLPPPVHRHSRHPEPLRDLSVTGPD